VKTCFLPVRIAKKDGQSPPFFGGEATQTQGLGWFCVVLAWFEGGGQNDWRMTLRLSALHLLFNNLHVRSSGQCAFPSDVVPALRDDAGRAAP
jgi:hypothetical protein